jgi:hypothetical protein
MPKAVLRALKVFAPLARLTVAEYVRAAICRQLWSEVGPLVQRARDPKVAPRSQLAAIKRLDLLRRAAVHMSPLGLKLARAKAAKTHKPRQRTAYEIARDWPRHTIPPC